MRVVLKKIRGVPKVGTMQVIASAWLLMVKCQFGIVSRNAMRSHAKSEYERSAHNWRHNWLQIWGWRTRRAKLICPLMSNICNQALSNVLSCLNIIKGGQHYEGWSTHLSENMFSNQITPWMVSTVHHLTHASVSYPWKVCENASHMFFTNRSSTFVRYWPSVKAEPKWMGSKRLRMKVKVIW